MEEEETVTKKNGEWSVRHGGLFNGGSGNINCCSASGFLTDCLNDIKNWSDSNPEHNVLTVFIDKKQDWGGTRQPSDLDKLISKIIPRDRIFRPVDLKGNYSSLREAAQNGAWPTFENLKGKIIFVLTGGHVLDHNKTQKEYVQDRGNNALIFVAPDADETSDVLGKPDQFNSQTVGWVVFYNIKFGGDETIIPLIKSMGYISRVWNLEEKKKTRSEFYANYDKFDSRYRNLVNQHANIIAVFEFEENKFNNGKMEGVKPKPSVHHHHKIESICNEHGKSATNTVDGHHHHKRGSKCEHGKWATDNINGHHHHKRGSKCEHGKWATDEQINNN
jgi:hypothetical protein